MVTVGAMDSHWSRWWRRITDSPDEGGSRTAVPQGHSARDAAEHETEWSDALTASVLTWTAFLGG